MLKDCSEDIKEKAEAILVKGLGDAALRLSMGESPDVFNMIESIDKIFGSKRAASKIAVLTSVFSKRYAYNKNTTKYIDEHNQALAQLESMDEDADIPDSLKGPILISSFGTDSQFESCIAVLRVRDSIPSWEELTADFILEAIRIRTLQKNSDPDNDANPKAGKKRTLFADKIESKTGNQACVYCHMQGHSADKYHQSPANLNNRLSKREKDAILAALATKPHKKKYGEESHFGGIIKDCRGISRKHYVLFRKRPALCVPFLATCKATSRSPCSSRLSFLTFACASCSCRGAARQSPPAFNFAIRPFRTFAIRPFHVLACRSSSPLPLMRRHAMPRLIVTSAARFVRVLYDPCHFCAFARRRRISPNPAVGLVLPPDCLPCTQAARSHS